MDLIRKTKELTSTGIWEFGFIHALEGDGLLFNPQSLRQIDPRQGRSGR